MKLNLQKKLFLILLTFAFINAPLCSQTVYQLITNNTELEVDKKYIIVGQSGTNYFVLNTQNTNNRASFNCTANVSGNQISLSSDYRSVKLGSSNGFWTLNDTIQNSPNPGFLYAASSSNNYLRTRDNDNDANSRWSININPDGIANVIAQGTFTRNVLQFNAANNPPLFSCYASASQTPVYFYKEVINEEPNLLVSTNTISVSYSEGFGPSDPEILTISGSNLNGSDVSLDATSNFEISLDNISYSESITLPTYDGIPTSIYVRLVSGLPVNSYLGTLQITGGGDVDGATVQLEGTVNAPFSLPYANQLRTAADFSDAVQDGFTFSNVISQTGSGGYALFNTIGSSVVSPAINFSAYEGLLIQFSPATFGTIDAPVLAVFLSDDNGATYNLIEEYNPLTSTHTFENLFINISSYTSTEGRIKIERTSGSPIRLRDLIITGYTGYPEINANTTYQNVTLADGALVQVTDNVIVTVSSTLTKVSSDGFFILGSGARLTQTVTATDKIYPIGTSTAYLPSTINAGSGNSAVFSVGVTNTLDPCSGADPEQSVPATWYVESTFPTPSAVTLSFDFASVSPGAGFDALTGKIVHCGATLEDKGSVTGTVASGTGFSSFSPFLISSDPDVLPVTWVNLSAKAVGKTVRVDWQTASENSNAFFEIERSIDGVKFEHVGKEDGAGNTGTVNSYWFIDHKPYTGVNYYRIKQVDQNGLFSYSTVASVPFGSKTMGIDHSLPNIIRFTGDVSGGKVFILSNDGKNVLTSRVDNDSQLSLAGLVPGMYVVVLNKDGIQITEKIFVR